MGLLLKIFNVSSLQKPAILKYLIELPPKKPFCFDQLLKDIKKSSSSHYKQWEYKNMLSAIFFFIFSQYVYSNPIVIEGNHIINSTVIYDDVDLDMSINTGGRFTINDFGHLTIKNSRIKVIISPKNPFFIYMENGNLNLENSTIQVISKDIPARPRVIAFYNLINNVKGNLFITNNIFNVNLTYTVGLIKSSIDFNTQNHIVKKNTITNFHGGITLLNTNKSHIEDNILRQVSYGAIFVSGQDLNILNNNIFFPGNFDVGDGILLINSKNVLISENKIFNSSCYGIQIINSSEIKLMSNTIVDGITYAIYLSSDLKNAVISKVLKEKFLLSMKNTLNNKITIAYNYLSQNRYGITAQNSSELSVHDNFFIQRFDDAYTRKFWTDNTILLENTTNLIWFNNLYKEAYSQVNGDTNLDNNKFVVFPKMGGVIL